MLCLETAEHLPPERADSFVEDLVKLAPVVVFSAAIPGQGGTDHLNEQWPEYWAQRFRKLSYVVVDTLRMRFWSNEAMSAMYAQNSILYVRKDVYDSSAEIIALPVWSTGSRGRRASQSAQECRCRRDLRGELEDTLEECFRGALTASPQT